MNSLPSGIGDARGFYGKYRGKVLDNAAPLGLGRIIAEVAAIPGSRLNWAMPCVPYAGPQVGFYAMPPLDANVWIEFEGGDPNYPIWSGCFWGEGEVPRGPELLPNPATKIFKTAFVTLILNDVPEVGGFILRCLPEAVATPLSMTFNSTGITINASPAIIKLVTEEGITLEFPPGNMALTESAVKVTLPPSTLTLTEAVMSLNATDVKITADGAAQVSAGGDVSVEAGGALRMEAGGDASIAAAGAAEVTAGADIAITASAATEITSLSVALTAVVEVDGDMLVDGDQVAVLKTTIRGATTTSPPFLKPCTLPPCYGPTMPYRSTPGGRLVWSCKPARRPPR